MLATFLSAFLSLALGTTALPSSSPSSASGLPLSLWEPKAGDTFIVDTKENVGYLVHENGRYTSFDVVTGQRRRVYYIGRSYNATTPTKAWVASSVHVKGDRLTFGKTGRFFRLYDEGERTAYGIHGYGREDDMFSQDSRFQSMGCVIVREHILNIIEKTYELNDQKMNVITVYGLETLPEHIALGAEERKG